MTYDMVEEDGGLKVEGGDDDYRGERGSVFKIDLLKRMATVTLILKTGKRKESLRVQWRRMWWVERGGRGKEATEFLEERMEWSNSNTSVHLDYGSIASSHGYSASVRALAWQKYYY